MGTHTMVMRTWDITGTLDTVDQSKYEITIQHSNGKIIESTSWEWNLGNYARENSEDGSRRSTETNHIGDHSPGCGFTTIF